MTAELATEIEWRAIPGFPDYFVSELGDVVSVKWSPPRQLGRNPEASGYTRVILRDADNTPRWLRVHQVVALAFIGPRPDGYDVRHLDGNPGNNAVSNLAYGTHSENMQDAVRHGTNPSASKTHCKHGHEFTPENTRLRNGRGGRECRACARRRHAVHEHCPRKGIVASWPIRSEPSPPHASFAMVTCGCPRHVVYCKAQATRHGLTATYYPDPERAS